jgi:hypothetical protein
MKDGRRWPWLVLAITVVSTMALLIVGKRGVDIATVLALPVAVVGVVVAAIALRQQDSTSRERDALQGLARAVHTERQRFIDQALGHSLATACPTDPAETSFTDPSPGEPLATVLDSLPVHWHETDGDQTGTITTVASFFESIQNRRMVVLGEPGAGKTFLLSWLILKAIQKSTETSTGNNEHHMAAVPVFLSLPSCQIPHSEEYTAEQHLSHLDSWICSRISQDYKLKPSTVISLVKNHHIIPVLDGLDEVDIETNENAPQAERPRAAAIVHALNADRDRPVILACRSIEYDNIATGGQGTEPETLLASAQHIIVRPLGPQQICDYLRHRFGGHDEQLRSRWQPVADAVMDDQPLRSVLAKPLYLFLAITLYSREHTEPQELCTMTEDHAREHLIQGFIHAVTAHEEHARQHHWTEERITSWLRNIARHQHDSATRHNRSEIDIVLPDLWKIAQRQYPRWVPVIFTALPSLIISVLSLTLENSFGDILAGFFLIYATLYGYSSFRKAITLERIDFYAVRTPRGRKKLLRKMAFGLAAGLTFGLTVGLAVGLAGGLTVGLTGGLTGGLTFGLTDGLTDEVRSASSATELAMQCINYGLTLGLTGGLTVGLTFGLAGGLTFGLAGGLMFGLAGGLAVGLAVGLRCGNGSAWLRYWLAMRSAARQGFLPQRPAKFLDWCLKTGLMRMAGTSLQFRHREHQAWLLRTTTGNQPVSTIETSP